MNNFNKLLAEHKDKTKFYHDKNACNRQIKFKINDTVTYFDKINKIWKLAKIIKFSDSPRSVELLDLQTKRFIRRNQVDINNFSNNNYCNFDIKPNLNKNQNDLNYIPKNSHWENYRNEAKNTISQCDDQQFYTTRSGRVVKPVDRMNISKF